MRHKPLRLPCPGSAKTSQTAAGAFRIMREAGFRFFALLCLFLTAARAPGQDPVRVIEQRFDFREFRFDITVESSKPGLKLLKIGLYNEFAYTPKQHSPSPEIAIKSSADYLIEIFGASDSTIKAAAPVLELRRNNKTRFTIGMTCRPTDFVYNGLYRMTSKPVLIFSDGSRVILNREVLYPSDFIDFYEKRFPSDPTLLEWAGSSDIGKRIKAGLLLCKSTLPKSVLNPVFNKMLEDTSRAIQMCAVESIGRLRYVEYAGQIADKFVKAASSYDADDCLVALNGLNYKPLTSLVIGRFDTTQNIQILEVCCAWLEKEDYEKQAYRHIVNKIKARPSAEVMDACLPLISKWKMKEVGSRVLTTLTQLPANSYSHSLYADALLDIGDPEIASKSMSLLEQNGAWATQPEKRKVYEALLSIVVGYAHTPSLPLVKKLLSPDQSKGDLLTALYSLQRNLKPGRADAGLAAYANALKPSIARLISDPAVPSQVKLECFSLVGDLKIKEAVDPLLKLIVDQKPYNYLISEATDILIVLNDTAIAAKTLSLLQQHNDWFYQPEKKQICVALLSIVIRYAYPASIPLIKELLKPEQPEYLPESILSYLVAMQKAETSAKAALQAYCQPLKRPVFLLTTHPDMGIKEGALLVYCYSAQQSDIPTREAVVKKFLLSQNVEEQMIAIHAMLQYRLTGLAPDACQLYHKTTDRDLIDALQSSFERLEYPCR